MKKFFAPLLLLILFSSCINEEHIQAPITEIATLSAQTPALHVVPSVTEQKIVTATSEPLMYKVSEFGEGIVFSHAISPDGNQLAVGSSAGLFIYDTKTKEKLKHISTRFPANIIKVVYSTDGELIAFESVLTEKNKINITVITASSEQILLEANIEHPSSHVVISQDNNFLLAVPAVSYWKGPCGSTVEIWNIQKKQSVLSLQPPTDPSIDQFYDCQILNNVAISQNSKLIVAGFEGGIVAWDLDTGRQRFSAPAYSGQIRTIFIDKDNKTIVTGDNGGAIRYWDASTGENYRTTSALGENISSARLSDDKKQLIITMEDLSMTAFEYSTGKLIGQIGISPEHLLWDSLIEKLYEDGFLAIDEPLSSYGYFTIDNKIAFSKNGNFIAVSCVVINAATGQFVTKLEGCKDNKPINTREFGNEILAVGNSEFQETNGDYTFVGNLTLWSSTTGELLINQQFPKGIHSMSFSTNNELLAVGMDYISLWDLKNNVATKNFYPSTGRVEYVGFQENDQLLIVVTVPDYIISKFDIKSGKLLALIRPSFPEYIYPYGNVTATRNYLITNSYVADINSGSSLLKFGNNWSPLPVITADENILILLENELHFIDMQTGKELYKANIPIISNPIISPNQKHLAFLTPDGKIQIWDISRIKELSKQQN